MVTRVVQFTEEQVEMGSTLMMWSHSLAMLGISCKGQQRLSARPTGSGAIPHLCAKVSSSPHSFWGHAAICVLGDKSDKLRQNCKGLFANKTKGLSIGVLSFHVFNC